MMHDPILPLQMQNHDLFPPQFDASLPAILLIVQQPLEYPPP